MAEELNKEESTQEQETVGVEVKEEVTQKQETVEVKEEATQEKETVEVKEEATQEKETVKVKEESTQEKETVEVKKESTQEKETVEVKKDTAIDSGEKKTEETTDKKTNSNEKKPYDRNDRKQGQNGGFRPRAGNRRFFYRKKVCKFCTRQIEEKAIDYKNVDMLKKFVMPSGKIVPRRINGCCNRHQRLLSKEIKRARIIAFLPFLDR